MMTWAPLKSSHLDAFDYDRDMGVLHVRFRGGGTYSFKDVPADAADGLGTAESPGKYFASNIQGRFKPIW